MTRSTGRRDSNHATIRDQLRKVPGMVVVDVGGYSGLGADLLIRWQDGAPILVEVKQDHKQALTDSEKRLRDKLGVYWLRAHCVEDVLAHVGLSNEAPPW